MFGFLGLVEHRRFELLTPTLPVLCATNCANAPLTSISIPWKAAFVNHELPILFLQKNGLHAACTCAVTSRDRNSIRGGNCEKETWNRYDERPAGRPYSAVQPALMMSQILEALFNLSDVAIAGKFADYRALGSVGSTTLLGTKDELIDGAVL